jgi:hypothetical protein
LRVLIDFYPDALTISDNLGRDPLHFALANTRTAPDAAPKTVRLLLTLSPNLVNPPSEDDGPNPFLFLLEYASEINAEHNSDELRESIKASLILLLDAKPNPTPTVFTALRSLPYWLFPTAILSQTVQAMLNDKMNGRFPTVILMMDLYMQILVLCFYHYTVTESIDLRAGAREVAISPGTLFSLYLGATYFTLRQFVQIVSLIWLKSFRPFLRAWILHSDNWLDLMYIVVVFYWTSAMHRGVLSFDQFRNGSALSAMVLWAKFFIFPRSYSIDFSVSVSGSIYAARRLIPFISLLPCFLFLYAQLVYTMFRSSARYDCSADDRRYDGFDDEEIIMDKQCQEDNTKPFCHLWSAFLRVFTMFLGEVDERDFATSRVATLWFALFMLFAVILLANMLIAIVTDSYKVIQDHEAAAVFYTNRLSFLAETDAIGSFPCFQLTPASRKGYVDGWTGDAWQSLWYTFEFGPNETIWSHQFWAFRFFPVLGATVAIPCWFLLGVFTCGAVWPPQIREWMFASSTWKRTRAQEEEELQEHRRREEYKLENEVVETRVNFYQGLAENRQQLAQIKASIAERKQEIRKEMKKIQFVMGNLFEQANADRDDDSSG